MRDRVASLPETSNAALAAGIALASAAMIGAVWWMQSRGYAPCELCLKERVPYYIAIPAALALAATRPRRSWNRLGFVGLALLFLVGTGLGLYHTGVEGKLWAGPSECTGLVAAPAAVGDFLKQLSQVTVVRCDEAALQIFGLSLAAWNAIASAALMIAALAGARRASRV